MVQYIKESAKFLQGVISGAGDVRFIDLSKEILNEVEKLEPKYFTPEARYKFVIVRAKIKGLSETRGIGPNNRESLQRIAEELIEILDSYQGFDSTQVLKKFDFISDPELKKIIERDYRELSMILLPDGAWKSAVVMSGSILEAILHDVITSDTERESNAKSWSSAPKKAGIVKPFEKWTLDNLIQVSIFLGLLPLGRGNSIDQVLRDYRNFVHPKKEIRTGHACNEAEALMSKGALDAVCNHLNELLSSHVINKK